MPEQKYRFDATFSDHNRRHRFEITQLVTQHKDVGFFRHWLSDMRGRYPELAQYVVDTAELIIQASEENDADNT